jgi:isopropylmalate/homocitrate/citramalate synthase
LSKEHFETVRAIKNTGIGLKTMGITRVDTGNPERAIDKGIEAGLDVILLAIYGVSIPGLKTERDYLELIETSVRYTKTKGTYCAFWVPGSRWNPEFTLHLYESAISGGADRVDLAGTGCISPTAYKIMTGRLKEIAGEKTVGVHCHNHFGVGTACALAGIEAGAEVVHTSVNGMSDGGGIAAFEEVVMCLLSFYGLETGIDISRLSELSRAVEQISGHRVHGWKPIVGHTVYGETSDSHLERILRGRGSSTAGSDKERSSWSAFGLRPSAIGQRIEVMFGPQALVGRGIRAKADSMGVVIGDIEMEEIKTNLKKGIEAKGGLSEEEMEDLIRAAAQQGERS